MIDSHELKRNSMKLVPVAVLAVLLFSGFVNVSAAGLSSSTSSHTTISSAIFQGKTAPLSSFAGRAPPAAPSTKSSATFLTPPSDLNVGSSRVSVSSSGSGPKLSVPTTPANALTAGSDSAHGFAGLSSLDSANAQPDGLIVTPPDQGLCTDGQTILEPINVAISAYTTSGVQILPAVSLYFLFGTPLVNFPTGDVRCFHDPATGHWFISQLDLEAVGSSVFTAKLDGFSYIQLAVSATTDPLGSYFVYNIPTIDNGSQGTPSNPGCPCFGDQPLLGVDKYGVYLSTNEFPIFVGGFNGAQVYALDKAELVAGSPFVTLVHIDAGPDLFPFGGYAASLQPAMNSPGQHFAKNTEYFLSALQFTDTYDDRIAIWALENTNTLDSVPNLNLVFSVLHSEVYGAPSTGIFAAGQPQGYRPLAQALGKCTPPFNIPGCGAANNIKERINADDDRMQMVTYADNMLWAGLESLVQSPGAEIHPGIAWFIVSPSSFPGGVTGTIVNQGYISGGKASVLYPSVVANNNGLGAVSFTLTSDGNWPSAAYATISVAGTGPIHIMAAGTGPTDDFSGYPAFGGNGIARWGDYSWGVAMPNGRILLASEWIPPTARTPFTNYGTFITVVTV